jgi:hypothetical protein
MAVSEAVMGVSEVSANNKVALDNKVALKANSNKVDIQAILIHFPVGKTI